MTSTSLHTRKKGPGRRHIDVGGTEARRNDKLFEPDRASARYAKRYRHILSIPVNPVVAAKLCAARQAEEAERRAARAARRAAAK